MTRFTAQRQKWLILCLLLCLAAGAASAQAFRAAVAKTDITPDDPQQLLGYGARKSTGVHDRIYHRVTVMDDGKNRFVLVSSDICLIAPSEYDKVAARVQKKYGIAPENFWWTLTHTHSAPELGPPGLPESFMGERYKHEYDRKYTDDAEQKLLDAVGEAIHNLAPARLSAGWGHSNANINRRARNVNGSTSLGINPDLPVDRRIGMLRIDKADGSPLAVIANYAMHGTVIGGQCTLISGDAPGVVADYVEKKTGAAMLYINGAAGNIAPIYSTQPGPQRLKQFEAMLGERILEAYAQMPPSSPDIRLSPGSFTVETPKKENLKWPAYMADYVRRTAPGGEVVRIPVRTLKINSDIAIWAAPLELFCEISNEIRDRSPFPYTFYFGYTNGWLGYLLTDREITFGGYEPTVSPYAPGAEGRLIEGVMSHLEGTMRKP